LIATNTVDSKREPIGFVGLGRLGLAVASLLLEEGFLVVGCKRGHSAELEALGGAVPGAGTVADVADAARVIFTCVPSEAALREVIAGTDGVLSAQRSRVLVIDLSTLTVTLKQELRERLVASGGDMLDCPVAGSSHALRERRAVLFASGDRAAYDEVAELLAVISPKGVYAGDFGSGMKLKAVAGLLGTIHTAAAAEAVNLAKALGLDPSGVVKIISGTTATSGMFDLRARLMAEGSFEGTLGTVDMMRKDLALIGMQAESAGARTPLFSLAASLYDALGARGHGRSDPAKLVALLDDLADEVAR
jgi:3-hydroxyisobutyrate dehydrogenase